jgi:acetylornithine deacetylase/succinyl-diaminopimelate desuccinylase-like protein
MTFMGMNIDMQEAVEILRQYLRIDTTNPPGNELSAAGFLAAIFKREGIPFTIHESRPGRGNLVATLKGDGTQRPVLLLNHMDVVGVERAKWSVDPFSGEIRDGYIWGRGTLDMKGMAIMQLMAMLKAKRAGFKLSRDIIFLAVADEETNGTHGARWMLENHPDEVAAEFVLNEGSFGILESAGIKYPYFPISTAEKVPLWLHIRTQGKAGHGSMPPDEHAVHRLVRLLKRLVAWNQKATLTPEMAALLAALGRNMDNPVRGWLLRHANLYPVWSLLKPVLRKVPVMRNMLANSVSINMLSGGHKVNVVPSRAEAFVDFRLLPDVNPQDFINQLKQRLRIGNDEIEVVVQESGSRSPTDTALFTALSYAIRRTYPQAVVSPSLSAGFSDSRYFRNRGVVAYGIIPVLLHPADLDAIHGHNERIEIDSFIKGIDIVYDTIKYLAGTR